MTDVVRYQREPDDVAWPRSAQERAVARDGRIMQAIIKEKGEAAALADRLDAQLMLLTRATINATRAAISAAEYEITDSQERHIMETVDKELLEYHKQHQVGYYRLAGEQFAKQISRDITPEKPPTPTPHTFWQQLALGALRG